MSEADTFIHTPAPEVLALDLDDTLYRTSEAFLVISALASKERFCDQDTLKSARFEKEKTGETFDLDAFLFARGVAADEISGLYDLFSAQQDPERFLYLDGLNLIRAIERSQAQSYVLTRGTTQLQKAKLFSAGLHNFPHVITDELVKSRIISTTRDAHGVYNIEASVGPHESMILRALTGTLIDDRPAGLAGLPEIQWSGILLQRPGGLRRAQMGSPPEGSIKLPNLNPIAEQVMKGGLVKDLVHKQLAISPPT